MIADKKLFNKGLGLMIGFAVVFVILLLPIYGGQNALDALDKLYNQISKGSANYIPSLQESAKKFAGKAVSLDMEFKDENQAKEIEPLFVKSGALVRITDKNMKVAGDMGKIFANCLEDSLDMFNNNGNKVKSKYGIDEKKVMLNWNDALKKADQSLKDQRLFSESTLLQNVVKKGVECSYNYYKVEPQKITERMWIILFSLIFYVIYTLWYGYAIMYMFEGWGMKLSH